MAPLDDKKAFSERLAQALKRGGGRDTTSATQLAMQFNLRHPNEPITAQAAQKWLTGQARPTLDKIETLAAWLDVSTEWLRFGVGAPRTGLTHKDSNRTESVEKTRPFELTPDEMAFLIGYRKLSASQRTLLGELVQEFNFST